MILGTANKIKMDVNTEDFHICGDLYSVAVNTHLIYSYTQMLELMGA